MGAASNYMGQGSGTSQEGTAQGGSVRRACRAEIEANLRVGEHVGVKDIEFGGRFDRPHGVTVYVFDALDDDLVSPLGLGE